MNVREDSGAALKMDRRPVSRNSLCLRVRLLRPRRIAPYRGNNGESYLDTLQTNISLPEADTGNVAPFKELIFSPLFELLPEIPRASSPGHPGRHLALLR